MVAFAVDVAEEVAMLVVVTAEDILVADADGAAEANFCTASSNWSGSEEMPDMIVPAVSEEDLTSFLRWRFLLLLDLSYSVSISAFAGMVA